MVRLGGAQPGVGAVRVAPRRADPRSNYHLTTGSCMPGYIQPRFNIQHRVAAIALYRALLSRCASANTLQDEERTSLSNAIRNKFRQNRKLQSPRQLGLVFRASYKVLDCLDASRSPNSRSSDLLKAIIPSLPHGITRSPPRRRPAKPKPDPFAKNAYDILPPEKALLNVRPYAKTTGPRHVPRLAAANGVPFLRITKPQPVALSRVIRNTLQRRIASFDARTMLFNYWMPISSREDEWDEILESECGLEENNFLMTGVSEPKWAWQVHRATEANRQAYEKDLQRHRNTTARMTALVDKETALAIQEGQTVTRGRKRKPIRDRWLK